MNTQDKIKEIAAHVENNIIGRVANKIGDVRYDSLETLMEFVVKAGGGNHIEIGTLFGGSAIAVALVMKELSYNGTVFCVDPLDGYYRQLAPRDDCLDTQSGIPVTPKTLLANLNKFEVSNRVSIFQCRSDEVKLNELKFSTAYIDGDHRGDAPYNDFLLVKNITSDYILFDNHDDFHPDVKAACDKAIVNSKWEFVGKYGITYVIGKTGLQS